MLLAVKAWFSHDHRMRRAAASGYHQRDVAHYSPDGVGRPGRGCGRPQVAATCPVLRRSRTGDGRNPGGSARLGASRPWDSGRYEPASRDLRPGDELRAGLRHRGGLAPTTCHAAPDRHRQDHRASAERPGPRRSSPTSRSRRRSRRSRLRPGHFPCWSSPRHRPIGTSTRRQAERALTPDFSVGQAGGWSTLDCAPSTGRPQGLDNGIGDGAAFFACESTWTTLAAPFAGCRPEHGVGIHVRRLAATWRARTPQLGEDQVELTLFGSRTSIRLTAGAPRDYVLGFRPVSDLISRPNLYSVIVAVIAGVVGVVSVAQSRASALIGVFISVTTIPAAAELGVSTAFANWSQAAGALEQLVLNVVVLLAVGAVGLVIQRRYWTSHEDRLRHGAGGAPPPDRSRARGWPHRRPPPQPRSRTRPAPSKGRPRPSRSRQDRPSALYRRALACGRWHGGRGRPG